MTTWLQNIVKEVNENFMNDFRRIMIAIIRAGIFLAACNGRNGEEVEQEIQSEITLSDIAWDDYNSGNVWETWLYFCFSDGTVVDKELPYMSMVKKVDYADITGDGTDEVLIYRYFANTATEYTLINFFQIEENRVTEISPELELEELADDVWNVIDADFLKEEYDMPVLMMESYVKENMVTYADKRVLVGYQDGGWQILERQTYDYKSDN